MGNTERQPLPDSQQEILDPQHFYAAYVFDRANERGDLYAVINIQLPQNLSDEERELFKKLNTLRQ